MRVSIRIAISIAAALSGARAYALAAPYWTSAGDAAVYAKAKVSLIQAIAVAERETPGHAIHADFRSRNGQGYFEVLVVAQGKLQNVEVDAVNEHVSDSTAVGPADAVGADRTDTAISLEAAAARGDEIGDWAVDAGLLNVAGKRVFRVDVLKDGKLRTLEIDPASGNTVSPANSAA